MPARPYCRRSRTLRCTCPTAGGSLASTWPWWTTSTCASTGARYGGAVQGCSSGVQHGGSFRRTGTARMAGCWPGAGAGGWRGDGWMNGASSHSAGRTPPRAPLTRCLASPACLYRAAPRCCRSYFARIAEERMGPDDQVILVQHCPTWLIDWFWGHSAGKNLRQLVRGPLQGRARMHLAGGCAWGCAGGAGGRGLWWRLAVGERGGRHAAQQSFTNAAVPLYCTALRRRPALHDAPFLPAVRPWADPQPRALGDGDARGCGGAGVGGAVGGGCRAVCCCCCLLLPQVSGAAAACRYCLYDCSFD